MSAAALYGTAADGVVLLHFAFVLFVAAGGLLVLRWRGVAWFHIPAASWGVLVELAGWTCPLTPLENRLRMNAGEAAYDAGFVEDFWKTVWAYQEAPTPETEAPLRDFLSLEATRWQYVTGVDDETLVDPETWQHDFALLSRPGNDEVQLTLFRDYATNPPLYPKLHDYFRDRRVPLLAVWGRGDEIFGAAGARAFSADLPDAEVHLLEGGHFLLESALDEVVALMTDFLARRLAVR